MEREDMIVRGRFVLSEPDELPAGGLIENGAVLVEGERVSAVGPYEELRAAHPGARELGSDRHAVMPGLVNSHQHGQGLSTLQLGLLDDYLEPWGAAFFARCHPLDLYLDTLYAAARMLRAGVTTAVHFGYSRGLAGAESETRSVLRAYRDAGMRVAFGLEVGDRASFVYADDQLFLDSLPDSVAAPVRSLVADVVPYDSGDPWSLLERLREEYDGDPAVRLLVSPAGPQWCSDELLGRVAETARALEIGIQAHCLESAYQRQLEPSFYGAGTLEHLDRLGLLGETTSLAHAVWLSERDIELCAATGTQVAHNPSSNLRLRVGLAPVNRMLEAGVGVGVGTDGMALADDEGMLEELRLAARLRGLPGGAREAPSPAAADTIRMGTTAGARLSTFGAACGRLAPGTLADLVVLDWERICHPYVAPGVDALDTLVYRATTADVATVVAGGRVVVDDGALVGIDEHALATELAEVARTAVPEPVREAMELRRSLEPHVRAFYTDWRPAHGRPSYHVNALGDEGGDK